MTSAADRKRIADLHVKLRGTREQLAQATFQLKDLGKDYQDLEVDREILMKGLWIAHAMVGCPRLGRGNSYLLSLLNTIDKGKNLSGIRWRMLLNQTPLVVANFLDLVDPTAGVRRRNEAKRQLRLAGVNPRKFMVSVLKQ